MAVNGSRFLPLLILLFAVLSLGAGCSGDKRSSDKINPPLPYPDQETAKFIQAQVDSSDFLWYTDIKAAASSFMNEFGYTAEGVSTSSIRILGESLFHGKVEVELPDEIVTLTMERPFKQMGKKSIWQVTAVEERPWPRRSSK